MAFAFIIADFSDPHVLKVLQDQLYWEALDRLSGESITIFSINAPKRRRIVRGYKMMTSINFEHRDDLSPRDFVADFFGITGSGPVLMFFQISDDLILKPFVLRLLGDTPEEIYNEIQGSIKDAVDSVALVLPENRTNTKEIYELIESALLLRKASQIVRPLRHFRNGIREFLDFFPIS